MPIQTGCSQSGEPDQGSGNDLFGYNRSNHRVLSGRRVRTVWRQQTAVQFDAPGRYYPVVHWRNPRNTEIKASNVREFLTAVIFAV